MRELLIKTARVLASEAGPIQMQNLDCYPRVRLLFEILAALGCDTEQLKQSMRDATWMNCNKILVRQIEAIK